MASHYNSETQKERKKRYMSRIPKRPNLHIQKLNVGTTTFVRVVVSVDQSHAASVNYDNQNMSTPTSLVSEVKVKLKLADNENILCKFNL
ncbi:hypothetical protein MTR_7g010470 [Medicago truncatula]|nr:hypothetical protein MTR_7g010470 [Medicago truncatula]